MPEAATAAGGRRVWWRAAAVERFSRTPVNVEWSSLLKGQRPFVLPRIYPDWIRSFLSAADFQTLKASPIEVRVAITQHIRFLPTTVSTAMALGLYSTEKFWLRSEHWVINQCVNVDEASTLLLASGAAAPKTQPASGDTLVLLTRHKPDRPQIFESDGRVYLQPKSKVAVTNMDCTDPVGCQRTFDQGWMEAAELRG